MHNQISRRSFAALAAGLAAAIPAATVTASAALAAGPDPDAELVRLGREWHAAFDRADDCSDAEFDAVMTARMRIEDQILATPAAGIVGLGVKASLIDKFGIGEASYIEANLVDDVLRLASRQEV